MNKHKSNKIKENSNTVRHLIMGQITTTQNLVAIKEVRHAGQKTLTTTPSSIDHFINTGDLPLRMCSARHFGNVRHQTKATTWSSGPLASNNELNNAPILKYVPPQLKWFLCVKYCMDSSCQQTILCHDALRFLNQISYLGEGSICLNLQLPSPTMYCSRSCFVYLLSNLCSGQVNWATNLWALVLRTVNLYMVQEQVQ